MTRTLSLLTPSGRLTLGNLLGALRADGRGARSRRLLLRRRRPARDDHRRTTRRVLRDAIAEMADPAARRRPRPDAGHAVPAEPGAGARASWPTCWSARRTPAS